MDEIAVWYYVDGVAGISSGMVSIGRIPDQLTRVVAELVVRVLGMTSPERISGGVLGMVERAIVGTQFTWRAILLVEVVSQLRQVAPIVNQGFSYGSFLCYFFLEHAPSLQPHLFVQYLGPWVLRMVRWARLMPRTRGVDPEIGRAFSATSLELWR